MKNLVLLSALFACACSPVAEIDIDLSQPEMEAQFERAVETYYPYVDFAISDDAPIHVVQQDPRGDGKDLYIGWTEGPRCNKSIEIGMGADPNTLAHELGHAWGLSHTENPDNLMFHSTIDDNDLQLSDDQLDTVLKKVLASSACR